MNYKYLEALIHIHTLIIEDPTTQIVIDPLQTDFTCKLTHVLTEQDKAPRTVTKMIARDYFDPFRNVVANTLVAHIKDLDMKKLIIAAIKAEIKTELTRENNILREAKSLLRNRRK